VPTDLPTLIGISPGSLLAADEEAAGRRIDPTTAIVRS
jgi:hypothetical protein